MSKAGAVVCAGLGFGSFVILPIHLQETSRPKYVLAAGLLPGDQLDRGEGERGLPVTSGLLT